jgi:hypothetical protein
MRRSWGFDDLLCLYRTWYLQHLGWSLLSDMISDQTACLGIVFVTFHKKEPARLGVDELAVC